MGYLVLGLAGEEKRFNSTHISGWSQLKNWIAQTKRTWSTQNSRERKCVCNAFHLGKNQEQICEDTRFSTMGRNKVLALLWVQSSSKALPFLCTNMGVKSKYSFKAMETSLMAPILTSRKSNVELGTVPSDGCAWNCLTYRLWPSFFGAWLQAVNCCPRNDGTIYVQC